MSEHRAIKYKLDPSYRITSDFKYCTICEVQRRLWRMIDAMVVDDTLRDNLKALVEEAYDLGKRMDLKLREYNKDWQDGLLSPARPEISKLEVAA